MQLHIFTALQLGETNIWNEHLSTQNMSRAQGIVFWQQRTQHIYTEVKWKKENKREASDSCDVERC